MALTPVSSSMISAVGYDAETKTLTVQFSNGSAYNYEQVPDHEYDALVSAPSVGRYFLSNVRDRYRTS